MCVPLPIYTEGSFSSLEEKCMAIAINMPAVQMYYNSKKSETQTMFQKVMKQVGKSDTMNESNIQTNELMNIVKNWCKTTLYKAITSRTSVLISEKLQEQMLKKAHELGWTYHIQSIFTILKMPINKCYVVLEAIWDLDSLLYKYLHPFPKELEKSLTELARLEEIARRPINK